MLGVFIVLGLPIIVIGILLGIFHLLTRDKTDRCCNRFPY